ncbi:AAA family ATPase [Pseudomarimonas salicorniae]|uniref:ATP-binding protein n=1 Tax=Pseudomarimonas salicorniae TaxID=2933270 RepID=A0ABT0GDR7_9GAMM|nr:ATP-binding protein [Lysobacter sp. CAU 1642]
MRSKPCVVMLVGLPGSGKSEVAVALERELGLHRIDRDLIRVALFPRCSFSPAEKRAANHAALKALEVNCLMGRHSVLDGRTFSRLRERVELESRIETFGARAVAMWLNCPPALARERVAASSGHHAADRTPDLVDGVAARFEAPGLGCLELDACQPLGQMVSEAVRAVRELLAPD